MSNQLAHTMNGIPSDPDFDRQAKRLQDAVENLFACCQARIALQSERFGLPPAALRALLALGESRYLAPGELGRRLGVTKSRVTAVTTGLSRHKLIDKHPDPADARVTLLTLTPAGRRARDEVRRFMKGLYQSMLEHVEPAQREAVLSSLEVLHHCMEAVRVDIKS
jgi:DNA-binding MarR family transcriptional regulator